MKRNRRLLLSVFAIILIVATLALPMAASAGGALQARGFMLVLPGTQQSHTLTVGRISVTVPPDAMPEIGRAHV